MDAREKFGEHERSVRAGCGAVKFVDHAKLWSAHREYEKSE